MKRVQETKMKKSSWPQNSNLFQEWEQVKQEVMLHKWFESERAGHDIGWDRAFEDWLIRYGHEFFESQHDL